MSVYELIGSIPGNTPSQDEVSILADIYSFSELSRLFRQGIENFIVEALIEKKLVLLVDRSVSEDTLQQAKEQILGFLDNRLISDKIWADSSLIVVAIHSGTNSAVCCRRFRGVKCVSVSDTDGSDSLTHELAHSVLSTGNRFFDEGLALYFEYLFHGKFPEFFAKGFSLDSFPKEDDVYVALELSTRYAKAGKYFERSVGSVDRVAYQYALGFVFCFVEKVGLTSTYDYLKDAVRDGQWMELSSVLLGGETPERGQSRSLEMRSAEYESLWLKCRREMVSSFRLDECIRQLVERLNLDELHLSELEWLVKLVSQRMLVVSYRGEKLSKEEDGVYELAFPLLAKCTSDDAIISHAEMQFSVANLIWGRQNELDSHGEVESLMTKALSAVPLCPSVKIDAAALLHYMNPYDPETKSRIQELLSSAEEDPVFFAEVGTHREHLGL